MSWTVTSLPLTLNEVTQAKIRMEVISLLRITVRSFHCLSLVRSKKNSRSVNETSIAVGRAFQAVWDGALRSPAGLGAKSMVDVDGKIESLLHQLSQEGLLNDQFQQLMQLQDDSNPNFVKVGTRRWCSNIQ